MFRYEMTCKQDFHITYFSNQQFRIVLINLLVDTFSPEVKTKRKDISTNYTFKNGNVAEQYCV